jgi:hypothetical protein
MLRMILAIALFGCSCGSKASEESFARTTSMHIENGAKSSIAFESKYAKGTIEIDPDVSIDYRIETVTSSTGTTQRTRLTLDGKVLDFDGPELLIGGEGKGELKGEVDIVISSRGVVHRGPLHSR